MIRKIALGMLLASASAIPAQAASNIVANGGFEAPVAGTFFVNYGPGSTGISGWTVGGGNDNVDIVSGPPDAAGIPYEGQQYLDLIGFGTAGSIFQNLATTAGQVYNLTFAYSHNSFSGTPSAAADIFINGVSLSSITHSSGNAGSGNLDWRIFTGSFTATSGSTKLEFVNTAGATNAGVFLDAVSVTAVPEPATWAMMIAGFGLVGGAMRRRTRTQVSFA